MKKFLVLLVALAFSINGAFAKNIHKFKFNGHKYKLLYSAKVPEFSGFLNEYYKPGESYSTWSEMVAVHHYPNVYSPIDQTYNFREFLDGINCPSSMQFNLKKNSGMLDFILINAKQQPVIIEFNVFKYEKSPKCGTVAVQYAKRYAVKNSLEADNVKKEFEKYRKKVLGKVKSFDIPDVVEVAYDNGVEVVEIPKTDETVAEVQEEIKQEETAQAVESSAQNDENGNNSGTLETAVTQKTEIAAETNQKEFEEQIKKEDENDVISKEDKVTVLAENEAKEESVKDAVKDKLINVSEEQNKNETEDALENEKSAVLTVEKDKLLSEKESGQVEETKSEEISKEDKKEEIKEEIKEVAELKKDISNQKDEIKEEQTSVNKSKNKKEKQKVEKPKKQKVEKPKKQKVEKPKKQKVEKPKKQKNKKIKKAEK